MNNDIRGMLSRIVVLEEPQSLSVYQATQLSKDIIMHGEPISSPPKVLVLLVGNFSLSYVAEVPSALTNALAERRFQMEEEERKRNGSTLLYSGSVKKMARHYDDSLRNWMSLHQWWSDAWMRATRFGAVQAYLKNQGIKSIESGDYCNGTVLSAIGELIGSVRASTDKDVLRVRFLFTSVSRNHSSHAILHHPSSALDLTDHDAAPQPVARDYNFEWRNLSYVHCLHSLWNLDVCRYSARRCSKSSTTSSAPSR